MDILCSFLVTNVPVFINMLLNELHLLRSESLLLVLLGGRPRKNYI